MEPSNPYTPPKASVADVTTDTTEQLNRIAAGQRLVIMALLFSIVAQVFTRALGPLGVIFLLAAYVISIVGVVRLASALGSSRLTQVLYAIGLIVPLINIAILLVLSSRATRRLQAGGYKVGLLGAKARGA
jgi:hypothetical protein